MKIIDAKELDEIVNDNDNIDYFYQNQLIIKLTPNTQNKYVVKYALNYFYSDHDENEAIDRINSIYSLLNCVKCNEIKDNNLRFVNGIGVGNIFPKLMLVLQAGGDCAGKLPHENVISPRYMVIGTTSDFLKISLLKANVYFQSWITNLLKCVINNNGKTVRECYHNCSKILNQEIKILQPQTIVAMSTDVSKVFTELRMPFYKLYHPMFYIYKNIKSKLAEDLARI